MEPEESSSATQLASPPAVIDPGVADEESAAESAAAPESVAESAAEPELTVDELQSRDAFDALVADVPSRKPGSTIDPVSQSTGSELPQASDALAGPADSDRTEVVRAPIFDFSDRPERVAPHLERLDWVALGLALIAPPVGFVTSIVVRVLSQRRNGWTSRIARLATTVSVAMTAVLAVGVTIGVNIAEANAMSAAKLSASVPLCWELQTTPGILAEPGFGWPIDRTPLPETLAAMKAYQARWELLTLKAPSFAKAPVGSIAEAAAVLVNQVESSKSIDRAANLDRISIITAQSGLPEWVTTYCK